MTRDYSVLSVKIVDDKHGTETHIPAVKLVLRRNSYPNRWDKGLEIYRKENVVEVIQSGRAYVLNEAGRTIDSYDLDELMET